MQRNVTDILRDWFYRLPNGYAIQPYNKMELQVLSKVLVENNIDPKSIIESLDQVDQAFLDAKPVEEDSVKIGKYNAEIKPMNANTATENLHEIFYAVALAYIIQNKKPKTPVTLDDFISLIDKTGNALKDSNDTKQVALNTLASFPAKYLDADNKLIKGFFTYWDDANKAAFQTYQAMQQLYEPEKYNYAARINVRGSADVEAADNLVNIDITDKANNNIFISLKYGPAQFGSLSLNFLLQKLYGFEIEINNTKRGGLLNYMYYLGGDEAKAIDKTLKTYIEIVNNFTATYPEEDKQGEEWDLWSAIEPADPKTMDYNKWRANGMESDQGYAYRKMLNKVDPASKRKYWDAKKQYLNPAIDGMMDIATQNTEVKNDFAELIAYIFRQDKKRPNDTYLYVALGGKKLVSIPSWNMIKTQTKRLTIDIKPFDSAKADYLRMMEIYGDGELIATIPLKFRFADGQWTSDLAQKGPAPTFNHPQFEDFFGAAGSIVKGVK